MNLETIPTNGQRAVDFLAKYEEQPQLIVPNWAVDKEMTSEGVEVPRETFFNFVRQIASQVRKRISDSVCLDDNDTHRLKTNIYNLAERFGRDAAFGNLQDITTKDIALIVQEIAHGYRVKCEDCLTSPTKCQWRKANAPLADVHQKARNLSLNF